MKMFAIAVAMSLSAGAALAADPVEGVWKTKPDDNGNYGYVKVVPCGTASENIGRAIIWDMVAYGDGAYDDGKIWSPDRDKTYSSDMQLTGDKLAVRGCVLGICRDGGTWSRVK
jgi:uncharacterized protein (DUF2147 family)